jgi:hypothetical protein
MDYGIQGDCNVPVSFPTTAVFEESCLERLLYATTAITQFSA